MHLYEFSKALALETAPHLTDVPCVNAFILRMLKYPNWQQKKKSKVSLSASVGEEMVRPRLKRMTGSGNFNKYICSAMRAWCGPGKQPASPETEKKIGGRGCGRCSICLTAKDRKTDWKCCQCSEWGVQGPLC
jgi:hypothetical protein